jgi:hypothetical protein
MTYKYGFEHGGYIVGYSYQVWIFYKPSTNRIIRNIIEMKTLAAARAQFEIVKKRGNAKYCAIVRQRDYEVIEEFGDQGIEEEWLDARHSSSK